MDEKGIVKLVHQLWQTNNSYRFSSRARMKLFAEFVAIYYPEDYAMWDQAKLNCASDKSSSKCVNHLDLIWEPVKVDKPLYFNKSLERLRMSGYERHPTPAECFGLLVDFFKNKLDNKLKYVAENMLSGGGEWLSLAVQRDDDFLICSVNPRNLDWRGKYLVEGSVICDESIRFSIARMHSGQFIENTRFDPSFRRFLYSTDRLPKQLRQALLRLPSDGLCPVGYDSQLRISENGMRTSRGVKRKLLKREPIKEQSIVELAQNWDDKSPVYRMTGFVELLAKHHLDDYVAWDQAKLDYEAEFHNR
jgi:hypothetical protein